MPTPLLELRGLTKAFGPKVANDRISLVVQPGRIHALVGENGAGKTTLMTMIAGTARPDEGTILVDGQETEISSPQKAHGLGIGMVHQHFKLVPSLTVAANIFLGRELTRSGQLDVAGMETEVEQLSKRFGLEVDPRARVATLSVGLRQRVEVLKALSHDTRLLILDEPTAVLTPSETDELFVVIRELARKGCAVLFISHKLREVLSIADDVTVIRDGRVIDTLPAAGLSESDIARMMVGRDVLLRIKHTEAAPAHDVLRVQDLTLVDDRGVTVLDKLSLNVRAGEIVGIAGVEGNGQSELSAAIAGMRPTTSGTVTLEGHDITRATVARRRAAGLAYIPEDRHEEGTAPGLSVAENLVATHLRAPHVRQGWLNSHAVREMAERLISRFDVRGASPSTPVASLSGGNMQKVVIAREFESDPRLLMVSQPTRGVDVGAMEFVHNALVDSRDHGAGVLLFSADLNEVMSLSDRLLVMYRGAIVAEFTQADMSETAVGLAMAGVRPDQKTVEQAEAEHEKIAAEVSSATETEAGTHLDAPADVDPPLAPAAVAALETPAAPASPSSGSTAVAKADRPNAAGQLLRNVFTSWTQPILAIVLSLVIGAVIIAAIGANPLAAYNELFLSNFSSPQGVGALIAQLIPLLVLSSAVIISFRAGFFNIGGEGQLYVGAFAGAWAAFTFTSLPGPLLILVSFIAGFVAAAIWGLIPGALLAYWRVDIIVTTLMMSSIAVLLTGYLVTGPFKDPSAGLAGSKPIADSAALPVFNAEWGVGLDLVLALLITIVLGLILTRAVWGLKVRELGQMNRFAEYTGVNAKSMIMQIMGLSGAVSGLAGVIFVLGPNGGRFLQTFSPGYGFLGITVALLARLNPWAAIVAAVFYADMMAGSNSMQVNTNVPYPLVNVLQGLIILVITATLIWNRRRRRATSPEGSAITAPEVEHPTDSSQTSFEPGAGRVTTLEEVDRS